MDYILKLIDLCPILSKTDDIMIYVPGKFKSGPIKVNDIPYWMLMRYVTNISYCRIEQTTNFALCIYIEEKRNEDD